MKNKEKPMVTMKSWEEFRSLGLLLIINQILHIFGWSIVFDFDEDYNHETNTGTILRVYPARVRFRGFADKNITDSYQKVTKYMKENVNQLLEEVE